VKKNQKQTGDRFRVNEVNQSYLQHYHSIENHTTFYSLLKIRLSRNAIPWFLKVAATSVNLRFQSASDVNHVHKCTLDVGCRYITSNLLSWPSGYSPRRRVSPPLGRHQFMHDTWWQRHVCVWTTCLRLLREKGEAGNRTRDPLSRESNAIIITEP